MRGECPSSRRRGTPLSSSSSCSLSTLATRSLFPPSRFVRPAPPRPPPSPGEPLALIAVRPVAAGAQHCPLRRDSDSRVKPPSARPYAPPSGSLRDSST
ncbi:hypothetical protein VTO73DRAFT_5771 [Trametes versicolor]